MKHVTRGASLKVAQIDHFKVHDMIKIMEDGSMRFVDQAEVCSAGVTFTPQLTDKERQVDDL